MKIDISKHYFSYYAEKSEAETLNGFHVGEIITDWHGDTGCVLTIFKDGRVRTDSNGMGELSELRKVRSRKKIEAYLSDLHRVDIGFMMETHNEEIASIR